MDIKKQLVMIPVTCDCCNNKEMAQIGYSDIVDSYIIECQKCSNEQTIHFTNYDSVMGHHDKDIDVVEGSKMSIQDVLDWQYGRKKLSKNLFKFS
jgi:hypothetical protein